jgi:hypothetical protein
MVHTPYLVRPFYDNIIVALYMPQYTTRTCRIATPDVTKVLLIDNYYVKGYEMDRQGLLNFTFVHQLGFVILALFYYFGGTRLSIEHNSRIIGLDLSI